MIGDLMIQHSGPKSRSTRDVLTCSEFPIVSIYDSLDGKVIRKKHKTAISHITYDKFALISLFHSKFVCLRLKIYWDRTTLYN